MKTLIALLFVVALAATSALAASSDLLWTPQTNFHSVNQNAVQAIAPDALTKALTVNSVVYNLTNYLMYRLIIPAGTTTCQVRTMATITKPTSPAGTGQAAVFPASQVVSSAKNVNSPFLNLSGCTSAYLQIH